MKGTLARVLFFVVDKFMLTMHIDIKGKKSAIYIIILHAYKYVTVF